MLKQEKSSTVLYAIMKDITVPTKQSPALCLVWPFSAAAAAAVTARTAAAAAAETAKTVTAARGQLEGGADCHPAPARPPGLTLPAAGAVTARRFCRRRAGTLWWDRPAHGPPESLPSTGRHRAGGLGVDGSDGGVGAPAAYTNWTAPSGRPEGRGTLRRGTDRHWTGCVDHKSSGEY